MNGRKLLRWMFVLFLITLLLTGCGPGQIFGPTVTLTSAQSSNSTITAQDILAETSQTEWDMVVFGDSDMWLSFEYYSEYFEEDLGIEIVVHSEIRPPTNFFVKQFLENQELQSLIAEAEIIVFNVPFVYPGVGGACFNYYKEIEVDGCFAVSKTEYQEMTRSMIREIKRLVGDKGAMIRLQNMFVPIEYWQDSIRLRDRTQACLECFAAYWEAQAEVAKEEGIQVVDVFTLFHGENHDQNPYEKGFIGSDQIHVNENGAQAIAELYREVGYEYWMP